MQAVARRVVSRRLSTAITSAPPAAAAESESRGVIMPTLGFLAASGATSVAACWFGGKRYVEDMETRKWLRTSRPGVATLVEENLKEYAPSAWSQSIRIDDDAAEAPAGHEAPFASGAPNVGSILLVPAARGLLGDTFFGRLHGVIGEAPASPAPAVPAGEATAAASAPSDQGDRGGPLTLAAAPGAPSAAAGGPSLEFEPIAPDDEGDAADSIDAVVEAAADGGSLDAPLGALRECSARLRSSGGPDGAAWGEFLSGSDSVVERTRAWAARSPPERPARLRVSDRAAERYEMALRAYDAAARGAAAARATPPPPRSRGGSGGAVRLIALPDEFLDDSGYGVPRAAAAGHEEERRVRLQWLRVQEAFALAELEAVEAQHVGVRRTREWWRSEAGGMASLRLRERESRLRARLAELKWQKGQVKKAAAFPADE